MDIGGRGGAARTVSLSPESFCGAMFRVFRLCFGHRSSLWLPGSHLLRSPFPHGGAQEVARSTLCGQTRGSLGKDEGSKVKDTGGSAFRFFRFPSPTKGDLPPDRLAPPSLRRSVAEEEQKTKERSRTRGPSAKEGPLVCGGVFDFSAWKVRPTFPCCQTPPLLLRSLQGGPPPSGRSGSPGRSPTGRCDPPGTR